MKPDATAGQIVTVEGLGHFDQAAIPDCFDRGVFSRFGDRPTVVVEIDCLSVLQVAGMESPIARWELVQSIESLDDFLRGRGQSLHNLRDFMLSVLGLGGGGQKGEAEERDCEKLTRGAGSGKKC